MGGTEKTATALRAGSELRRPMCVRGVTITSGDAPYAHPGFPTELLAMLRTTDEKPFEKFRSKMKASGGWDLLEFASAQKGAAIAHGWVNDFTLERLPWGFSCEVLDEEPVAPNKQKFSSPDTN